MKHDTHILQEIYKHRQTKLFVTYTIVRLRTHVVFAVLHSHIVSTYEFITCYNGTRVHDILFLGSIAEII